MAERSVLVKLGLEVTDFNRGIKSAGSALEDLVKKGNKSEQVASTNLGRLEQSARLQAADWNQVGGSLTKVGAAMGAVGVAVGVTGTRYNMLQQSSRAALSTLMGGAKAANEQMNKLDAFARTSPFAKDVFIKAQQQMLAFGIESQKVIPYLDALQNAVAAAGGNNNDLAGLATIMSKIQSSAKITAVDLMQFGNYGVDAAGLIGQAMGKTGGQIRSEITAGTIDASAALDALAQGMQSKFGGAADNVKQTLSGAFDRVKAAWRDLSSDLMQPFVGSQGGGLFVDLLNQAADLMRWMQRLPEPIEQVGFALGGATTSSLLLAGGFMKLVPGLLETQRSLSNLASSGVPVISRLAASFSSVPTHVGNMVASLSSGQGALKSLGGAAKSAGSALVGALGGGPMIGVTAALAGITIGIMQLAKQAEQAKRRARELADTLDDVTGSLTQDSRKWAAEQFVEIADGLEALGSSAKEATDAYMAGPAAFDAYRKSMRDVMDESQSVYAMHSTGSDLAVRSLDNMAVAAEDAATHQDRLTDSMGEGEDATDGIADGMSGAAEATRDAGEALEGYTKALKGLQDYQDAQADSVAKANKAQRDWVDAIDKANKVLEANGQAWDINTEAGRQNREAVDDLGAAWRDQVTAMIGATDANNNAVYSLDEIQAVAQSSYDSFINLATGLGASTEEAEWLAAQLGLLPADVETRYKLEQSDRGDLEELQGLLDGLPEEVITSILAQGDQAMDVAEAVKQALEAGVPPERLMRIEAMDDATEIIDLVQAEIEWLTKMPGTAHLSADDGATRTISPVQTAVSKINDNKWVAKLSAQDNITPVVTSVQQVINSLTGKTITLTTNHNINTVYSSSGGMVASGSYQGGFLPGLNQGGWVPGQRAGYDNVLWPRKSPAGGLLMQPLEGTEFVVRSAQARKHAALLEAINSGSYAPGMYAGGALQSMQMQAFQQSAPAAVSGPSVVINDHSVVNYPISEPKTVQTARQLQLAASSVGGLV